MNFHSVDAEERVLALERGLRSEHDHHRAEVAALRTLLEQQQEQIEELRERVHVLVQRQEALRAWTRDR